MFAYHYRKITPEVKCKTDKMYTPIITFCKPESETALM